MQNVLQAHFQQSNKLFLAELTKQFVKVFSKHTWPQNITIRYFFGFFGSLPNSI